MINLESKKLLLNVKLSDNIKDVKQEIWDLKGIPSDTIRRLRRTCSILQLCHASVHLARGNGPFEPGGHSGSSSNQQRPRFLAR